MVSWSGVTGVAVVGEALAVVLEHLQLHLRRDEDDGVAEAVLGRQLDRLRRPGADDVGLRVRLLDGLGPRVQVPVRVEVAVELRRAVLGPALQHHVDRLAEPGSGRRRVDRVRPVLHPRAERDGDLQPSARHDVEHRVLLREAVRVAEVGRRPEHADLGLRLGDERGGREVGRRVHAVRGVVVLVEDERVVAEPVGQEHLGQVPLVQLAPDLGVVVAVGELDPQRRVLLVILRQRRVREEVEEVELRVVEQAHRSPLSAARAIRSLRSLIDLRSWPLGPFAHSARSSISALGRSGHSLTPLARRSPLSAARAIRSLPLARRSPLSAARAIRSLAAHRGHPQAVSCRSR